MLVYDLTAFLIDQKKSLEIATNVYQDQDINSFLLKNGLLCCCCVFATKPKEKGIILMENLKVSIPTSSSWRTST